MARLPRKRTWQKKILNVRYAVDFNIVGDNISDIADFTVEKYEFKTNDTLDPDTREKAIKAITDELWQQIEQLKLQRRQLLANMFKAAESALDEVVAEAE